MNEIVAVHNDLVDLPLKKFNASEIDILHTICYEVKNKETDEVKISFDKIRELSHFQNKNEKQLVESIEQTNKKLLQLNFKVGTERDFIQFTLFPTFRVNANDGELTVKVNEPFAYLLNNFSGNYTSFELQQSSKLKSSYAKQIYKKLQEFKDTGYWTTSMESFREYLDIPYSYTPHNIDQRVIWPALDELEPIFENLKVKKTYQKSVSGKGRPKVSGYEWTFKPEIIKSKEELTQELSQEQIAEITGWEKAHRYCPVCHRPIFQKRLTNENGEYILYGHSDFKTGECKYITYDLANLLQEYQLPKAPEELTEDQIENKKKLRDLIKNLFKN